MVDKQVFELHLPLQNEQTIKIPKGANILGVRSSIDKHTVILSHSAYKDAEFVNKDINMYFTQPFNVPATATFLGVCNVMKELVGHFPALVSAYIFID